MKWNIVCFVTIILSCQFNVSAQNSGDAKKNEKQFVFITLPMGISIPSDGSKEDGLKTAMFYLASKDETVINCIHLSSCKITKTEDLGVDLEESPTRTQNGALNMGVTVKARIKRCAVTWDAEFVVDKDISVKHLYLNGIGGLLDWSLLSYFENNLDPTFKNWILEGRYNARNAPMLKAGQKFKLTGIHSKLYGLASDDKWTCFILRDEPKKREASVSIQLTKATTLDAKSVSVDYEIKEAPAKALHFDVYRSTTDHLDNLLSIIENNDLKKLGDTTIQQEMGNLNVAAADASLTLGKHTALTFIKGTELKPDTRMPYIIVVATCNGAKTQVYFKKWLLGAVSHGFDRWAMDGGWWWTTFVQKFTLPEWETNMAKQLQTKDGYDDVIPFNWMHSCAGDKHGLAEDAGVDLGFQIWGWVNGHRRHNGDVVDIHIIGPSRGTVVVTQALKTLSEKLKTKNDPFGGSFVQLTLLDPHPANNTFEQKWGSWEFQKNDKNEEVDYYNNTIPSLLSLPPDINPATGINMRKPFPNIPQHPPHFDKLSTMSIFNILVILYGKYLKTMPEKIGNVQYGFENNYFLHQSRYFRVAAMDSATDFQNKVSDSHITIPLGVKKIDIYFQHTQAYMLYNQDDQEFLQNLWGMVSANTISCADGTIDLNKYRMDLTNVTIDGIGTIGHNEVPIVYEQLWVDAGDLNRSPEK